MTDTMSNQSSANNHSLDLSNRYKVQTIKTEVREWAEIAVSIGLIYRATTHIILWLAVRSGQGYEPDDIHPLDVDYGISGQIAVRGDNVDEPLPNKSEAVIQSMTGLGAFITVATATLSYQINWLTLGGVLVAPHALVVIADPVWWAVDQALNRDDSAATRGDDGA